MRKLSMLICLIGLVYQGFCQKLEKPVIDKITGDTTISTSKERLVTNVNLVSSDVLYIRLVKSKGKYFANFQIYKNSPVIFSVNKGDKAIIKLTDNSLVTLYSVDDLLSDNRVTSYGSNILNDTKGSMFYLLQPADIEALKKTGVSVVRLETSKVNFDYDVKPKNADLIIKSLQLIDK